MFNASTVGNAPQRILQLMETSRAVAVDGTRPIAIRTAAVTLLGEDNFPASGETLLSLLEPQQPGELQSAAMRSLGLMSEPAAVLALLKRERWNAYTPPVREAMVAMLVSRPRHVGALFAAIEAGDIPAWSIAPAQRSQLLKHGDQEIRQHAEALFKQVQPGDRMKVYENYQAVLALKPDPENGRAVFKKHCASCHRLDRDGIAVGPDLFGIRNQPKEAILLHIIIPEYEITPGFAGYVVETKDGRTLSGLIASETPTGVTLRRALGEEETILRSQIVSLSATGLSLMPQELEKNMTQQELADLLAYLKGEAAGR